MFYKICAASTSANFSNILQTVGVCNIYLGIIICKIVSLVSEMYLCQTPSWQTICQSERTVVQLK